MSESSVFVNSINRGGCQFLKKHKGTHFFPITFFILKTIFCWLQSGNAKNTFEKLTKFCCSTHGLLHLKYLHRFILSNFLDWERTIQATLTICYMHIQYKYNMHSAFVKVSNCPPLPQKQDPVVRFGKPVNLRTGTFCKIATNHKLTDSDDSVMESRIYFFPAAFKPPKVIQENSQRTNRLQ